MITHYAHIARGTAFIQLSPDGTKRVTRLNDASLSTDDMASIEAAIVPGELLTIAKYLHGVLFKTDLAELRYMQTEADDCQLCIESYEVAENAGILFDPA